jgi:tRNA nucleotidyltransferase (CCA-adding enzyme)
MMNFNELFIINRPTFHNFMLLRDYKEIDNIWNVPQHPPNHPEGAVHIHTFHVMEAMWDICKREQISNQWSHILMLSALCHDLGKALPENGGTTRFRIDKQKWIAYGHAQAGVPLTRSLLDKMEVRKECWDYICKLVEHHMFCVERQEIKDKHVNKLYDDLRSADVSIKDLLYLIEADQSGRPPLPKGLGRGQKLKDVAERLGLL